MLRNSAYVLSKLILKLSEEFELCFPLKLLTRYKTFAAQKLSDLVGFALTLTTRFEKESRVESHFRLLQIFTQKFESPGFQIEHKKNWKVDASSRGIQSKIHLKSKC